MTVLSQGGVILFIVLVVFEGVVPQNVIVPTVTTELDSNGVVTPARPGFPAVPPDSPIVVEDPKKTLTIRDIITPSDTCKLIVDRFASAVSSFTQCSVSNARPVHLCQWCIFPYLSVQETYNELFTTIDETGNPCKDYFTNLDRIEIVADAYNYVKNLWRKGKCDYCFKRFENGTLRLEITEDVLNFELRYESSISCFDGHMHSNNTCTECKPLYEDLNALYIDMVRKYGENVCLDIVDTMNTTRAIWSEIYHCIPPRKSELWLHIGFGVVAGIPVIFYLLVYLLSSKQESKVLQQRRLAEVFSVTSMNDSEASGYLSSRPGHSNASASGSTSLKTSDPPNSQS